MYNLKQKNHPIVDLDFLAIPSKTLFCFSLYNKFLPALLLIVIYFNFLIIARASVQQNTFFGLLTLWHVHLLFLIYALYRLWKLQTGKSLYVFLKKKKG